MTTTNGKLAIPAKKLYIYIFIHLFRNAEIFTHKKKGFSKSNFCEGK
jgi:hypothetical protein